MGRRTWTSARDTLVAAPEALVTKPLKKLFRQQQPDGGGGSGSGSLASSVVGGGGSRRKGGEHDSDADGDGDGDDAGQDQALLLHGSPRSAAGGNSSKPSPLKSQTP